MSKVKRIDKLLRARRKLDAMAHQNNDITWRKYPNYNFIQDALTTEIARIKNKDWSKLRDNAINMWRKKVNHK